MAEIGVTYMAVFVVVYRQEKTTCTMFGRINNNYYIIDGAH